MTQLQQVGTVATSIFTEDGYTRVIYHNTTVVRFNNTLIELNSGGWQTATTKTRMNQASNQFDLGYQVYQKDFTWFVDFKGKAHTFSDGILLYR